MKERDHHWRISDDRKQTVKDALDVAVPAEFATSLPEHYHHDPLPRSQAEESAYIDTMGIQLDRFYALIQGTESYFDNNPKHTAYTYVAQLPSDDLRAEPKAYAFTVRREVTEVFKRMAFDRYMDLRDHSPLGHELARDIARSWELPEGYELPIDEEITL